MLGQPASSQTVCSPSRLTRLLSSRNSGPILAFVLIQDGFFSIGVWLLRTSSRSSFRPSGTSVTAVTLRFARACAGSRRIRPNAGERGREVPQPVGHDLVLRGARPRGGFGVAARLAQRAGPVVVTRPHAGRGGRVELRQRALLDALGAHGVPHPRGPAQQRV